VIIISLWRSQRFTSKGDEGHSAFVYLIPTASFRGERFASLAESMRPARLSGDVRCVSAREREREREREVHDNWTKVGRGGGGRGMGRKKETQRDTASFSKRRNCNAESPGGISDSNLPTAAAEWQRIGSSVYL